MKKFCTFVFFGFFIAMVSFASKNSLEVSTIKSGAFEKIVHLHLNIHKGQSLHIENQKKNGVLIIKDSSGLPSIINGTIVGKGFLIIDNPNGVFIGKSGEIHTLGFIGTSLDSSFAKPYQGHTITFKPEKSSYFVINKGSIITNKDSLVSLMGLFVRNAKTGLIVSGHTALLSDGEYVLGLKDGKMAYFFKNGHSLDFQKR